MKEKGFALVELLAVVTIIGTLSTIVLGSLGTAQDQTKDVKIKALMSQMRTQAELFALDNNGKYNGTRSLGFHDDDRNACRAGGSGTLFDPSMDNSIAELVDAAIDEAPSSSVRVYCVAGRDGNNGWAFAVPLNNPDTGFTGFCVDSSGGVKEVSIGFSSFGTPLGARAGTIACP